MVLLEYLPAGVAVRYPSGPWRFLCAGLHILTALCINHSDNICVMILFPDHLGAKTKHEEKNDRHLTVYTTEAGSEVVVTIWKSDDGFLMQNTTYKVDIIALTDAIAILRYHQGWRRGEEKEMINSLLLGVAIDVILDKIENNASND